MELLGYNSESSINYIKYSSYEGVKTASEFLQKENVPRIYRKQILESFDIETIEVMWVDNKTYGLRFFDNINANEKGRYLFETFSSNTNRNGLALPYEWNIMINIKQWQIEEGTTIIKGKVAPQFDFGDSIMAGLNKCT